MRDRLIAQGVQVQEMYLFGSFARETATVNSDIDILVVVDLLQGPWKTEAIVRTEAQQIDTRLVTVCLSPAQFDERISSLAREVKHYGISVR